MLDPVALAVLKGRLEQIADEMDATLFRSAFNPIIAEAHDASHGLYDAANGETLVQGKAGLPIFVGVMAFAVKAVIDKAARDGGIVDGDVYIFNDPYEGGGAPLFSTNSNGRSVSRSASSRGFAIVADEQMNVGDDP